MDICIYCGDLATTIDHVIPVEWASTVQRKARRRLDLPGPKVPACLDCNSILTNHKIFTIEERREFIATRLSNQIRNRRDTQWTEDDLKDLGPNLRSSVRQAIADYRHLELRAEYAKSPPAFIRRYRG